MDESEPWASEAPDGGVKAAGGPVIGPTPTTSAVTIGCTEAAAAPTVFADARAFFLEVPVGDVAFALFRLVADEE